MDGIQHRIILTVAPDHFFTQKHHINGVVTSSQVYLDNIGQTNLTVGAVQSGLIDIGTVNQDHCVGLIVFIEVRKRCAIAYPNGICTLCWGIYCQASISSVGLVQALQQALVRDQLLIIAAFQIGLVAIRTNLFILVGKYLGIVLCLYHGHITGVLHGRIGRIRQGVYLLVGLGDTAVEGQLHHIRPLVAILHSILLGSRQLHSHDDLMATSSQVHRKVCLMYPGRFLCIALVAIVYCLGHTVND